MMEFELFGWRIKSAFHFLLANIPFCNCGCALLHTLHLILVSFCVWAAQSKYAKSHIWIAGSAELSIKHRRHLYLNESRECIC